MALMRTALIIVALFVAVLAVCQDIMPLDIPPCTNDCPPPGPLLTNLTLTWEAPSNCQSQLYFTTDLSKEWCLYDIVNPPVEINPQDHAQMFFKVLTAVTNN